MNIWKQCDTAADLRETKYASNEKVAPKLVLEVSSPIFLSKRGKKSPIKQMAMVYWVQVHSKYLNCSGCDAYSVLRKRIWNWSSEGGRHLLVSGLCVPFWCHWTLRGEATEHRKYSARFGVFFHQWCYEQTVWFCFIAECLEVALFTDLEGGSSLKLRARETKADSLEQWVPLLERWEGWVSVSSSYSSWQAGGLT